MTPLLVDVRRSEIVTTVATICEKLCFGIVQSGQLSSIYPFIKIHLHSPCSIRYVILYIEPCCTMFLVCKRHFFTGSDTYKWMIVVLVTYFSIPTRVNLLVTNFTDLAIKIDSATELIKSIKYFPKLYGTIGRMAIFLHLPI